MKHEERERLAQPADAMQRQASALFENALATCGRLDVMVFGALEGGFLARRAALAGARVVVVDDDPARLSAAAAAASPLEIEWRTVSPADAHELFRPGQFDSLLGHHALSIAPDPLPLLRSAGRLLQTDGALALSALHPAFTGVARGRHFGSVPVDLLLPGFPRVPLTHHSVGALSAALESAGFVPAVWYEADGGDDLTPCLAFGAGKEKW
jgi:SAM-dependent methyltransferase